MFRCLLSLSLDDQNLAQDILRRARQKSDRSVGPYLPYSIMMRTRVCAHKPRFNCNNRLSSTRTNGYKKRWLSVCLSVSYCMIMIMMMMILRLALPCRALLLSFTFISYRIIRVVVVVVELAITLLYNRH